MSLESDLNSIMRSLTKDEMNAFAQTFNDHITEGNTGHVDEIDWDSLLMVNGQYPSSSSAGPSGPSCDPGCVEGIWSPSFLTEGDCEFLMTSSNLCQNPGSCPGDTDPCTMEFYCFEQEGSWYGRCCCEPI